MTMRPAIAQLLDVRLAGIDHRLDGEDHARFQLQAGAGFAVMQHLRFFMEFLPMPWPQNSRTTL